MATANGPATAFCTIVSKNYLHYARTLMDSVREVHPECQRWVLLVDEVRGDFDPAREPFQLLEVSQLPLPNLKQFLFRYTILELNTAVKPWFLEWLFEHAGVDRVVYLDPDIYVYRPLTEVLAPIADGGLMVLTPHLTGELADGRFPTEPDILKAGAYNLGFIGLGRHPQLEKFLRWWQARLEFDCRVDFPGGLFVDQKWIDLAPCLFDGVTILRHPGCNVAYWNLAHRRVDRKVAAGFSLRPPSEDGRRRKPAATGDFTVNGRPLIFFHFSGLDPQAPEEFSKYQNRFTLDTLGDAAELVRDYCTRVLANGQAECRKWRYAYGSFANGEPLADAIRYAYRTSPELRAEGGADPFSADFSSLNEPWGSRRRPLVTRLMRAVWEANPALRFVYPDIDGRSRAAYSRAFRDFIYRDERVAERFVAPLRREADEGAIGYGSALDWTLRLLHPLSRRFPREWYQRLKFAVKRAISGAKSVKREAKSEERSTLHPPRSTLFSLAAMGELLGRVRRRVQEVFGATPAGPLQSLAYWPARPARATIGGCHGLNVAGYICGENGIGESARLCARAAQAAGVSFSLHDADFGNSGRAEDHSWTHRLATQNRHWANLVHINADQTPLAFLNLGREFFEGKYNIAYWAWELPEFPDVWLRAFQLYDEIWVPSRFVQAAVMAKTDKPVAVMPHGIHCEPSRTLARADFALPEKDFLFLMMYDSESYQERKNPEAAVAAFRRAFPRPHRVGLVIKVNNPASQPEQVRALRAAFGGHPNIHLIERTLPRTDVWRLEELCDAYVSLHRSEGFGLGLAEAMFLGKPVIGTNWSGNVDFMTGENSCPVDYRLVRVEKTVGPYARGQVWAEPDMDDAAQQMRRLVEDEAYYRRITANGQATIRTHFSPAHVGARYRERLSAIAEAFGIPSTREKTAA